MTDQHPTEKLTMTELHGLGSWELVVAALDAVSDDGVPLLRRGILQEIRSITFQIELVDCAPAQNARLSRLCAVLCYLDEARVRPRAAPP